MRKQALFLGALLGALAIDTAPGWTQSWFFSQFEVAHSCLAVDAVNRDVVFVYGQRPGDGNPCVFRTADGGATWDVFPLNGWGFYDLAAVDSNRIWAVSWQGIYHSADGGHSWELQYGKGDSAVYMFDYIEMFDSLNGVAAGDPPQGEGKPLPILQTRDGGRTWINVNDSCLIDAHLSDVWRSLDFVSPTVGYLRVAYFAVPLSNFRLSKTMDGGATWNPTPLRSDQFNVVRFYDENLGLALWKGNTPVYRTTDGGQTWKSYPLQLGDEWFRDVEFIPGDPSRVVAALHRTLVFSADTGRTWTELPAPDLLGIEDIDMVDSTLGWIVGERGIVRMSKPGGAILGVRGSGVPEQYRLFPASPNPFSQTTAIQLRLSRSQRVTLEVFDVCGRRVATLAESVRLGPGRHSFVFNGENLPAGVYLIRVLTGGLSAVQRVVLLK